jgi:hypothetical protein
MDAYTYRGGDNILKQFLDIQVKLKIVQIGHSLKIDIFTVSIICKDRLCGLVVRVPGYRSRGPGSIPGAIRFCEK